MPWRSASETKRRYRVPVANIQCPIPTPFSEVTICPTAPSLDISILDKGSKSDMSSFSDNLFFDSDMLG